jgi:hypothetical protein
MTSDKTLRYMAVTYVVLFLLVTELERHSRRGPITPLDLILIAPMLWFLGFVTIQRGSLVWVVFPVHRSKNPVLFWSITATMFLLGLICACAGIARV